MNMTLLEMVRNYQMLLEKKELLEKQMKENNTDIEDAKAEITQQMIDDDCPSITVGDYKFSLQAKTAYTKRSEKELAEAGIDFLGTLREEGFGDLIKETVNSRTLQSAMKEFVESNGELTEGLEKIIDAYDYNDIYRRKAAKKKTAGVK